MGRVGQPDFAARATMAHKDPFGQESLGLDFGAEDKSKPAAVEVLAVDKARIRAIAEELGPLLSSPAAAPESVVVHYLLDVWKAFTAQHSLADLVAEAKGGF